MIPFAFDKCRHSKSKANDDCNPYWKKNELHGRNPAHLTRMSDTVSEEERGFAAAF